jgi:hypothetical protein
MTRLIEHILHLSGWVALLIVFAVPARLARQWD